MKHQGFIKWALRLFKTLFTNLLRNCAKVSLVSVPKPPLGLSAAPGGRAARAENAWLCDLNGGSSEACSREAPWRLTAAITSSSKGTWITWQKILRRQYYTYMLLSWWPLERFILRFSCSAFHLSHLQCSLWVFWRIVKNVKSHSACLSLLLLWPEPALLALRVDDAYAKAAPVCSTWFRSQLEVLKETQRHTTQDRNENDKSMTLGNSTKIAARLQQLTPHHMYLASVQTTNFTNQHLPKGL